MSGTSTGSRRRAVERIAARRRGRRSKGFTLLDLFPPKPAGPPICEPAEEHPADPGQAAPVEAAPIEVAQVEPAPVAAAPGTPPGDPGSQGEESDPAPAEPAPEERPWWVPDPAIQQRYFAELGVGWRERTKVADFIYDQDEWEEWYWGRRRRRWRLYAGSASSDDYGRF